MTTKSTPMITKVIPPNAKASTPTNRKPAPRPTKRIGHAHATTGTPNPRARKTPIATASRPPKIESGMVTATASGHSVSMT